MKGKIEPPLHVAWEITRRCNAQCLHCSSNSGTEVQLGQELSTSDALRVIDQLAGTGVRVLAFSGGEPLLHSDVIPLISHATRCGLNTGVCTNGALVDESLARRLKQAGLGSVTVSLDGACAATHDRLRCYPGLFDLAGRAIRILVQAGHRVGVSFTPTALNYPEASRVVHLACALGADSVCISQYVPTGRGTRDLMLAPSDLGDLARDLLRLREGYAGRMRIYSHDCHVALLLAPEDREGYLGCGAGTATAGIRADGAVTPCIFMPNLAGDLRQRTFQDIWDDSPVLHALRNRERLQQGNCGACRFKLVCGGCRAVAMALHGDPLGGDSSCWMFPEPDAPLEETLAAV